MKNLKQNKKKIYSCIEFFVITYNNKFLKYVNDFKLLRNKCHIFNN